MRISLTKKLADKLKIDLFPEEEKKSFDELYSWRANVIENGRCRIVVFMNDASRYTVVLNGIKAKDWSNLPELFTQTLRETLLAEQANPEVIDRYLSEAGKVTYTRNADRQKTAWLNKAGEYAGYVSRRHNDNIGLSLAASRAFVGTTNAKDMYYPNERMLELLARYGLPVKKCRAFDLDIHLALVEKSVHRKLRVPAAVTFDQLHKIFQTAFGWRKYHFFSFMLFAEGREGEEPAVELVMTKDELQYSKKAKLLAGVKLSDYIPKYKYLLYVYDYGDDWQHYIEVTDILDDCTDNLPVLLAGEGDAPPEDVGGVYGYEDFLAIINDPTHEDYQEMTEWAQSQLWEKFDFKKTAHRMKYSLTR